MLSPGTIYFIKDYNYEDGGTPTDKFLIVLYLNDDNSLLVRALPTSKQKIPDSKVFHGCTNNITFSFFMFEQGRVVGTKVDGSPFAFDFNTYIIVKDNVNILSTTSLLSYYPDRIYEVGSLSSDEFNRLLKCVKTSKHLKMKVKRLIVDIPS